MILGPPGAGKTQRLLDLVCDEVGTGVPSQRIAYVAFSRTAARTAAERAQSRLNLELKDLPWFRTIHSAALGLLSQSEPRLMLDEAWAEFAGRFGYVFSDVAEDDSSDKETPYRDLPCRTEDDRLRFAYDWGRNCRLAVDEMLARFPAKDLQAGVFRTFVRRIEQYKAEAGLVDFTDLLSRAFAEGTRPPVCVAFVDEAQDLSPLQIALVESWFSACERVYLAGDDDQAVFVHNGANPKWLVELARCCPLERLEVSHRLPSVIQAYAGRIIARNRLRVPKNFRPCADGGEVRFLDRQSAIRLVDGSQRTYVLARNRRFLAPVASELINRAVPFVIDGRGGPSPLSDPKLVRAVQTACDLCRGDEVRVLARDVEAMLAFVPGESPLKPRGVGGKLRPHQTSERGFSREELARDFGLATLLELLDGAGPLAPLKKVAAWKRDYLRTLLQRYGNLPHPLVTLTSCHGSKGGEADLVVVLPEMSQSSYREYRRGGQRGREAETRVFYVAVTRARKTLVIVLPRSRRHFDFPPSARDSRTGAGASRKAGAM